MSAKLHFSCKSYTKTMSRKVVFLRILAKYIVEWLDFAQFVCPLNIL